MLKKKCSTSILLQHLDFPHGEELDNVRGFFEDKDLSDKERQAYHRIDSEYYEKIAKLIERIRPDITTEGTNLQFSALLCKLL